MEKLTYVTENGTVLFSPDGKDSVTITDISEMGDTEFLEQIADTLANRETAAMFYERKYKEKCKELKAYGDTGLTPEEILDGKMLTGWISVEERLPETEDGYVHVMVSLDDGFVCTTDYTDNDGFELWADSGEVIAWMPLPEPYEPEVETALAEMPESCRRDIKIKQVKELQQEIDRRQKVEREAEALMCQGKVQESLQLISSLDDSVAAALLT